MIEYKAYHKKSLGGKKAGKARAVRRKAGGGKPATGAVPVRQVLLIASVILAVFLVGAAGATVYSWLGHSALFNVRDIDMNPCANITEEEVRGMLRGGPQGNIWTQSTSDIGRRLLTHPWVRDVSVRKAFPDTLVVRIVERRPVAMVNLDALYYVDAQGTIFKRLSAYDPKGYPIVTGFDRRDLAAGDAVTASNLRKTLELLQCAEGGALRRNVSEVHYDAQEGYTLVTRDNALQLKIGTTDFREAVRRIDAAMPKLAGLGPGPGVVDLKTAGRIFVRSGE